MIELNRVFLRRFALLLLLIPILVFFLFYLRLIIGLSVAGILVFGSIPLFRERFEEEPVRLDRKLFWGIILAVIFWAVLSGQGGILPQKWDYNFRNALFRDLINGKWPVLYHSGAALVYYFTYWLVPALLGKVGNFVGGPAIGWIVGNVALFIWSSTCLSVLALRLVVHFKAVRPWQVGVLMFVLVYFSGIDSLGVLLNRVTEGEWLFSESWSHLYPYCSNTASLSWVMNQALPAWLVTTLFLKEKTVQNYGFLGLLLLPYAPFPFVGLCGLLLFMAAGRLYCLRENPVLFLKECFSRQNLAAYLTILPVFFLFLINNASFSQKGNDLSILSHDQWKYLIPFLLFEFLIYALLLLPWNKTLPWLAVVLELLVTPFIMFLNGLDLIARSTIPALFVLMMLIIKFFVVDWPVSGVRRTRLFGVALAICVVAGSLTAFCSQARVMEEVLFPKKRISADRIGSFANLDPADQEFGEALPNFVVPPTRTKSFFFRYLMAPQKKENYLDGNSGLSTPA